MSAQRAHRNRARAGIWRVKVQRTFMPGKPAVDYPCTRCGRAILMREFYFVLRGKRRCQSCGQAFCERLAMLA